LMIKKRQGARCKPPDPDLDLGRFSPEWEVASAADGWGPRRRRGASVALSWLTLSALLLSPDETEEKGEDSGDGQRRQPN
jgi:hypothetical protein